MAKKILLVSRTRGYQRLFKEFPNLEIREFNSELLLLAAAKKSRSVPVFVVLEHGYKGLIENLLEQGNKVVVLVDFQFVRLSSLNGVRKSPRVRLVVIKVNPPKSKKGLFSDETMKALKKALAFAKVS
ncbi:MAG: hypothetical protein AAB443_02520 [Patescibacteria group bacterium]